MGQEFPQKTFGIGTWIERRRREPRVNLRDAIYDVLVRADSILEKYDVAKEPFFSTGLAFYSPITGDSNERIITIQSMDPINVGRADVIPFWTNGSLTVSVTTYKRGTPEVAGEQIFQIDPVESGQQPSEAGIRMLKGVGEVDITEADMTEAHTRDIIALTATLDHATPLVILAKELESSDIRVQTLLHDEQWKYLLEKARSVTVAEKVNALRQLQSQPILRREVLKELIDRFLENKKDQALISDPYFKLLDMASIPPPVLVELFTKKIKRGDFPQDYLNKLLVSWSNQVGRVEQDKDLAIFSGLATVIGSGLLYFASNEIVTPEVADSLKNNAHGVLVALGFTTLALYADSKSVNSDQLRAGITALQDVLEQKDTVENKED